MTAKGMVDTDAVRAIARNAPNQRVKLLLFYRHAGDAGLIDEEAAEQAGLLASCFWKRCGELRGLGYIEQPPALTTRRGTAGVSRIVCQITDAGRAYLAALEL